MTDAGKKKGVPMIVNVAKWTQPDYVKKAKQSNKLQMISISYSHYCEFARFALLAAKVDFEELQCIPGQHILPTLALRFSGETPAVSESAAMHKVGKEGESKAKAEKAARATATPVAVSAEGAIYTDSWDIAGVSGLAPCDEALKKILDECVGVDARHVAYYYLLQERNHSYFHEMGGVNDSWEWRSLWSIGLKYNITSMLGETFQVKDEAAKDAASARLKEACQRIEDGFLRKVGKGRYLSGTDAPGLGDIALAALLAPIVLPDGNYGGKFKGILDKVYEADEGLREMVECFRQTAAGAHCLMVYEKHRPLAERVTTSR
mmetsp:Transcript_49889/g.124502  ORF Transcript_49889/g.124502 Transcript_49889/m.124502 type:complete len:320 (-) Transcript_49889:302-1261(-)